jgi:uncharacterized RDD family membrane protein YckC
VRYAGVARRMVAYIIDLLIGLLWMAPLSQRVRTAAGTSYHLYNGRLGLSFAIYVVYALLLEKLAGGTVGKLVLGIRVRMEDGSPITWGASIARNLLRFIDFLPFFYLVGAIVAWTNPQRQRIGDKVAKTVVVFGSSIGASPVSGYGGPGVAVPPPPPPPPPVPPAPPAG